MCIILTLLVIIIIYVGLTAEGGVPWTSIQIAEGSYSVTSAYIPADVTDLLQWKVDTVEAPDNVGFIMRTFLYTADSSYYVGYFGMYYRMTGTTTTDSYVYIWTLAGGHCYDDTVLQGALPGQVTWDLMSEHVAIVNSTVTADFSDCSYYDTWSTVMRSASIARIEMELWDYRGKLDEYLAFSYRVIRGDISVSPTYAVNAVGSTQSFVCTALTTTGDSSIDIKWKGSDGVDIASAEDGTRTSTLSFDSLVLADEDTYTCYIEFSDGNSTEATAHLDVIEITGLESVGVTAGEDTTFTCSYTTLTQTATVLWYKVVSDGEDSEVTGTTTDDAGTAQLVLSAVTYEQTGEKYYCKISYNESGDGAVSFKADAVTLYVRESSTSLLVIYVAVAAAAGVAVIILIILLILNKSLRICYHGNAVPAGAHEHKIRPLNSSTKEDGHQKTDTADKTEGRPGLSIHMAEVTGDDNDK